MSSAGKTKSTRSSVAQDISWAFYARHAERVRTAPQIVADLASVDPRVALAAKRTFGLLELAADWLTTLNRELLGTPLDVCQAKGGANRVLKALKNMPTGGKK
jgi:hypothetical protein